PLSGTVDPGSAQTISIEFDDGIIGGLYADHLIVRTGMGDEALSVGLSNYCYSPDWAVNPSDYPLNMTVTAEINFGSYVPVDTSAVVIGAFINNESRGMAEIEYSLLFERYLGFLTVYGDSLDNNLPVTLRVWDGLSCIELGQDVGAFNFVANSNLGNGLTPYIVNLSLLHAQQFDLPAGWNWVSFNVDTQNDSINYVLAGLEASTNDMIKSHNGPFAFYVSGVGWVPQNMLIDNMSGYLMSLSNSEWFEVNGYTLNPANNPIYLTSGWNPISYQPQMAQLLAAALATLEPVTGDLIKNQFGFSQYVSGYGWAGSLLYMEPGYGYMLKISSIDTLIYPDPAPAAITGSGGSGDAASIFATNRHGSQGAIATPASILNSPDAVYPDDWTIDPAAFENTMTVTGSIVIDGEDQTGEFQAVGAFVDDECRGVAEPVYLEGLDQHLIFLMIYSNASSDEWIEFRLLTNNDEILTVNEQLEFQSNGMVGDIESPFVWTTDEALAVGEPETEALPTVFSLSQNFPNP
ncbi:MAG: hypothetical protein GY869_13605, partial [Planctomycetes bacterium]|nr:hypothetical protein [Planctomycetota bacterium]